MKEYLCVGVVTKPQGIKGEVKVKHYTDDPGRFLTLKSVFLDDKGETAVKVLSSRVSGEDVFLLLEGYIDRNAAENLRGTELYTDRKNAAPLPEGRYYIADLIGLKVTDDAGADLGTLVDVTQAGGTDVYSVKGPRNFLFPALKSVIRQVDIIGGTMMLDGKALAEVAVYDDED